jgi:hypothetical protein
MIASDPLRPLLADILLRAFSGLYDGFIPFTRIEALLDRLEGAR